MEQNYIQQSGTHTYKPVLTLHPLESLSERNTIDVANQTSSDKKATEKKGRKRRIVWDEACSLLLAKTMGKTM
jgi:hypothetical protein